MVIVVIQSVEESTGWAGPRTITIGELLLLAIGGCYDDDLFRRRWASILPECVTVSASWAGAPVVAQNLLVCRAAPRNETTCHAPAEAADAS